MFMKAKLTTLLLLAVSQYQLGCAGKGESQEAMKIATTESSNKEITDFSKFWTEFKVAALASNKEKITELTCFPFIDSYNQVYDTSNSLTSNNQEEFLKKYDTIFSKDVLDAIKYNSYRSYDSTQYTDVIGLNDIILLSRSTDRSKDLVFKLKNGNYCLSYIAYYP